MLKTLLRLAEQNDLNAQYNLGLCFYHGRGVPQDFHKAKEWLEKAANQGSVDAQVLVASMLEEGKGSRPNPQKALEWYQKAAGQGCATAEYRLGMLYLHTDDKEAKRWLKKAALLGHQEAKAFVEQRLN